MSEKAPQNAPNDPIANTEEGLVEAAAHAVPAESAAAAKPEAGSGKTFDFRSSKLWETARTVKEKFASGIERVRHTPLGAVVSAFERFGLRHGLNMSRIDQYESYYQKVHQKTLRVASAHDSRSRQVASSQEELARLEKSIKNVESRGLMTPKISATVERDRNKGTLRLNAAKEDRDKTAAKLKKYTDIKNGWEAEQKRAGERVLRAIEEKTAPYQERFNALEKLHNEAAAKMQTHVEARDAARKEIEELEALARGASFRWERNAYKNGVQELKKRAAGSQRNIDARLREQAALKKGMDRAKARLDRWGAVKNEVSGKLNKNKTHIGPPKKPEGWTEPEKAAETPDIVEAHVEEKKPFEQLEITMRQYIEAWNKTFPKDNVPIGMFKKTKGFEPGKKLAAVDAERLMLNVLLGSAEAKNGNLTGEALRQQRLEPVRRAVEQAQS
ncbi:MAG TPA: hypothetical protein VHD37_02200 [Candidatus Paceibacterota bacterium]|nr:hypothetical protein [Candidatus Paceibacterota bacterium]